MKFTATIDVAQYRNAAIDPFEENGILIRFNKDTTYIQLENIPPDQSVLSGEVDNLQRDLVNRDFKIKRLEHELKTCRDAIEFISKASPDVDTLTRDLLVDQIGTNWKQRTIYCVNFLRELNPSLSVQTVKDNLSRYRAIEPVELSATFDPTEFNGERWKCHSCGDFHLTDIEWTEQRRVELSTDIKPGPNATLTEDAAFVQAADATNSASFHADGDIVE